MMLTRPSSIELAADLGQVSLPLKRFLLIEQCPPAWHALDLYIFRDDEVTFYVGQSSVAFYRVWTHLKDGFKGRSSIGRFILCNWPVAMNFSIDLLSSRSDRFQSLGKEINAAEQALIGQYQPCFNIASNQQPTPLPARYSLPNTQPLHARSLRKMAREAGLIVKAEEKKSWLSDL